MRYPENPGHVPGNESSIDGALHAAETREAKQRVLFKLIEDVEPVGRTCDELEVVTGWFHQTVSARLRDLVLDEKIYWAGDRRPARSGVKVRVYVLQNGSDPAQVAAHPPKSKRPPAYVTLSP